MKIDSIKGPATYRQKLYTNKMKWIQQLPCDVKYYIYKEFLHYEVIMEEFKQVLMNQEASNLINILSILPVILSKPKLCLYMSEKMVFQNYRYFEIIYKRHKIRNDKQFKQMTKGQSFAAALFCSIHR